LIVTNLYYSPNRAPLLLSRESSFQSFVQKTIVGILIKDKAPKSPFRLISEDIMPVGMEKLFPDQILGIKYD
jgi:hypothetical protein